jgi:hypothetical protein
VNDLQRVTSLVVYPNPAKERIYLKITEGNPEDFSLLIYNSLGFLVWETEIEEILPGNFFSLDISRLPEGIYILKLKTDRQIFTGKLIRE